MTDYQREELYADYQRLKADVISYTRWRRDAEEYLEKAIEKLDEFEEMWSHEL